jgi:hypothetical protein
MTKIQMTETVLCDIRFGDCDLACLFLTLEHYGFEFLPAAAGEFRISIFGPPWRDFIGPIYLLLLYIQMIVFHRIK